MKDMIIAWLSQPENLLILSICLIQVYKLLRPYLPVALVGRIDKTGEFLGWGISSAYHAVEALEKKGLIDPKSKLSVFLDQLFDMATKQGVVLKIEDVIKAKAIVAAMAQAEKTPKSLPIVGPQEPPITGDSVAQ